jgi:methyltransferase (TIGR00027 family)
MKPNFILLIQRAMDFSGHLTLPDLSNSIGVAKSRYIQSLYEIPEYRNPDTLIRDLLSPPVRWLSALQAKIQLSRLRQYPFYYYLIARTKYYDQVFTDAIHSNVGNIINIGCGTDTRAYRFIAQLKLQGIKVLECDQAASIAIKRQLAKRAWQTDHVTYVEVDLNNHVWPDLECRLNEIPSAVLVMLEGVSPYIDEISFGRFLKFLAAKLSPGSVVAYDYKIRSAANDFKLGSHTKKLFRLPAAKNDVVAYHEALGFKVEHLELSSDLSLRLLPNLASSQTSAFVEDGLLKLTVPSPSQSHPPTSDSSAASGVLPF